jgi:hydrocephalus-inducing protein
MTEKPTRWILNSKETKKLYVKFFSTKVGSFNQILEFEIVGSYRPFKLKLQGTCEFPTVSQAPRNVFLTQKRLRPPTAPESYLSKCYINSEGTFDFGPLLIKKDPEKRATDIAKPNSTFFQITNNGKYKLDATFVLRSSLPGEERLPSDEGILPDKSPFIMDPEDMSLAVGETKNLNVYAFPQEAVEYKD